MATIMGNSDLVRQAVAYIFDAYKENLAKSPKSPKSYEDLLDEAAMRFNLGPMDCEALRHAICQSGKDNV
ncbi:MAG: hypothetical protein R3Y11_04645 [Pseudomonadota bacterium]